MLCLIYSPLCNTRPMRKICCTWTVAPQRAIYVHRTHNTYDAHIQKVGQLYGAAINCVTAVENDGAGNGDDCRAVASSPSHPPLNQRRRMCRVEIARRGLNIERGAWVKRTYHIVHGMLFYWYVHSNRSRFSNSCNKKKNNSYSMSAAIDWLTFICIAVAETINGVPQALNHISKWTKALLSLGVYVPKKNESILFTHMPHYLECRRFK